MYKNIKPVIAIDGTACSGKGTLAKNISREINFDHLDTGLLYRFLAFTSFKKKISLSKFEDIFSTKIDLNEIKSLNFDDLKSDSVSARASKLAKKKKVREFLIKFQRDFANHPPGKKGSVIDGRDIGTVIVPSAEIKFFVDADINVRAERRVKDLRNKISVLDSIKLLSIRDDNDKNRKNSPLKQADDAILIDTSTLSEKQVLKIALNKISTLLVKNQ